MGTANRGMASRWAILHENRNVSEPSIEDLLDRMEDVDLVLIEGFKLHRHQKLEVFRPSVGKPLLAVNDESIVGVATDAEEANLPNSKNKNMVFIDLNNIKDVADFIIKQTGLKAGGSYGAA